MCGTDLRRSPQWCSIQATWQPGDALSSDISQSKMSAKDEKTVVKKEKEKVVRAMDDVQPGDSISQVA